MQIAHHNAYSTIGWKTGVISALQYSMHI